jgi:hypothetical protein
VDRPGVGPDPVALLPGHVHAHLLPRQAGNQSRNKLC